MVEMLGLRVHKEADRGPPREPEAAPHWLPHESTTQGEGGSQHQLPGGEAAVLRRHTEARGTNESWSNNLAARAPTPEGPS